MAGTGAGLMILHVESGGPADRAGIVLGDVIVELQGKPALDTEHIQDLMAAAKVNEKIATTVIRGGAPLELSITLGERPAK